MKKIITAYIPYIVNNLYAKNVRRLLNSQNIETLPIKKVLINPVLFFKCRIFNFNWFEKVENRKQYILKCILLSFLHLCGKKIIFTIHNKQPHNIKNNTFSLKMMRKMCRKADAIVGLCPDTKEVICTLDENSCKKLRIIPHPNYILNYKNERAVDLRSKYGFKEEEMVFLFLGFISPYKNIELLLDTFQKIDVSNIKLLIAGEACNKEYQDKLVKLAYNNSNIIYDFRYIPDEEITHYYNTADIVVLPYHKISSLNSGAVYLSFSLKKTVICPNIGTINALKDHSFVYDYTYENEIEHAVKLHEAMLKACKDFSIDSKIIKNKGEEAYKYMLAEHSDYEIMCLYISLYTDLVNDKEYL